MPYIMQQSDVLVHIMILLWMKYTDLMASCCVTDKFKDFWIRKPCSDENVSKHVENVSVSSPITIDMGMVQSLSVLNFSEF